MTQTRQSVADAVQTIRVNLQYQAEYLRRLDLEDSEQVAQKLDRLRWNLKRFAEKNSV
jgi:hypothetical protein